MLKLPSSRNANLNLPEEPATMEPEDDDGNTKRSVRSLPNAIASLPKSPTASSHNRSLSRSGHSPFSNNRSLHDIVSPRLVSPLKSPLKNRRYVSLASLDVEDGSEGEDVFGDLLVKNIKALYLDADHNESRTTLETLQAVDSEEEDDVDDEDSFAGDWPKVTAPKKCHVPRHTHGLANVMINTEERGREKRAKSGTIWVQSPDGKRPHLELNIPGIAGTPLVSPTRARPKRRARRTLRRTSA